MTEFETGSGLSNGTADAIGCPMRIAALLLIACSSSAQVAHSTAPGEVQTPAETAPTTCSAGNLSELVRAAGLDGVAAAPGAEEYEADLDGDGTPERVIHIRQEAESENPMSGVIVTDHLVVFACADGTWTETARSSVDSEADNGTFDCQTGFTQIDIERVTTFDVLVVQSEGCQGSVDPRWYEERVSILSLRGSELPQVFTCASVEQHASGPCRSGTSITRDIQMNGDRIDVEMSRSHDPGGCEEEERPAEESLPNVAGTYTWSGAEFVASVDLCEPGM